MSEENEHFPAAFDLRIEVPAMPRAAQQDFVDGLLRYCADWRQPDPELRSVSAEARA